MTTVEVPHGSRSAVLRVAAVIAETADACSLVFDVPEELRERFTYQPGQFLTLRIPSDRTGSVARCYSLASSPHTDDQPKVTVKRTAEGYASNWVCDNVKAGDELEVLPPSGVFTPKDLDEDLLLFAAGSGITPVMSILKSALARGGGRVVLVYANRDHDSVIFAAELRELADKQSR
ncbi:FAD-binding oxidoreductase, partial [Nocardia gipuzkoensis]